MSVPKPEIKIHRAGPDPAVFAKSLADLLQFEADIRRQREVAELQYFVANETRRIVDYDQLFILRRARIGQGFEVSAVSSLATVDRNAPLIQALERFLAEPLRGDGAAAARPLAAGAATDEEEIADYPFRFWRWQPMADADGNVFAGLLVARKRAFTEGEEFRIARIADTAAHAWRTLTRDRPVSQIRKPDSKERKGILVALLVVVFFPVQMTAMAPVEVVAARPYTLAAPVNGVVSRIHVVPNAAVKKNQLLVSFDDLKLRNDLDLAREKVAVASARAERANSEAFGDAALSREIAITRAELDLARADFAYAQDMLRRGSIVAPRAGMAIFSDRRDWEGRAVQIGDPIIQLADPKDVMFQIELPAKEQMTLAPDDRVVVYLDAQPLWAIEGRLETASYQARMTPEGVLAFALTARATGTPPRIGSRGTAKVYGRWVPLFYSLLRRPIASLRQFAGL